MEKNKAPPSPPDRQRKKPAPKRATTGKEKENHWRWIQIAISILSFVAAGGAFAGGVPLTGAILILIIGVAAAAMTAAAEGVIRNRAALLVLQWAVVLVVVSVCASVIVELFLPCTIPVVAKAMGHDCLPNPIRVKIVSMRGDADRAEARYRSRSLHDKLAERAIPDVLNSCKQFSSVDRGTLPHADLVAEVHLNIARMCSQAAVLLLEQKADAFDISELANRVVYHAHELAEFYRAIEARGNQGDHEFLEHSKRNWDGAYYYLALGNRILQCNSSDSNLRLQFAKRARGAWRQYASRDPGSLPEDILLFGMLNLEENDPCAP